MYTTRVIYTMILIPYFSGHFDSVSSYTKDPVISTHCPRMHTARIVAAELLWLTLATYAVGWKTNKNVQIFMARMLDAATEKLYEKQSDQPVWLLPGRVDLIWWSLPS